MKKKKYIVWKVVRKHPLEDVYMSAISSVSRKYRVIYKIGEESKQMHGTKCLFAFKKKKDAENFCLFYGDAIMRGYTTLKPREKKTVGWVAPTDLNLNYNLERYWKGLSVWSRKAPTGTSTNDSRLQPKGVHESCDIGCVITRPVTL